MRALGALIDDLFELTRLESGELTWTMEQVRLDALLNEAVEAMRPTADAEAVTMTAELAPALAAAHGNPDKLQRVLFNLIQNAIHHTPPDGSVTVRAESVGDAIEIEVADTGLGIAGEHRERVFEPFYRADGARTDRRRRARPRGLARDRRGPRRVDLARGRGRRHARALPPAGEQRGAGARVTRRLRRRQMPDPSSPGDAP